MDAPQPHLHQNIGASTDHGLAYRLGSSVLNSLPIYGRLRSNSQTNHKADEKASPPMGGVRTPPPEYYVGSVLTEVEVEEGTSICSSAAAKLSSGCGSSTIIVGDTPSEGPDDDASTPTSGYFPDTGMGRFFKALASLLKALGSEAPAADMVLSWLPSVLGVISPNLKESSTGETPSVANHGHRTVVTGHSECSCFQCFQQQQKLELYHLWLQNRSQTGQSASQQYLLQNQTICMSCHQPILPPHHKSLLHRFTAALVLQIFTFAFIIYPYVKALLLAVYAWERRNHITERALTTVMVVSERVWLWTQWLFDGSAGGVGSQEWRRGEAKEQRVRRWIVKASGEVLGGLIDGLQVGISIWGTGGKGKGEGRIVAIE